MTDAKATPSERHEVIVDYHERFPAWGDLLSYTFRVESDLAASREALAEAQRKFADRCLKDPVVRLNNICSALEEQCAESPFSKASWDELTVENDELRQRATLAESRLAERTELLRECRDYLVTIDHAPEIYEYNPECVGCQLRDKIDAALPGAKGGG